MRIMCENWMKSRQNWHLYTFIRDHPTPFSLLNISYFFFSRNCFNLASCFGFKLWFVLATSAPTVSNEFETSLVFSSQRYPRIECYRTNLASSPFRQSPGYDYSHEEKVIDSHQLHVWISKIWFFINHTSR